MLEWLKENYPTVIICALLIAAVAAVIIKMIYNKIHHISTCSSCGSCPMAGSCGKKNTSSAGIERRGNVRQSEDIVNRNISLRYQKELNKLLERDGFAERFSSVYQEQKTGNGYYIISMDHPCELNKKIELCVTVCPDLSFLHNFYDDCDLDLTPDICTDCDITSNLDKIYKLLKPILTNEIISITGKCAGRWFDAICTAKQIQNNKFSASEGYSELRFEIWNGEVDKSVIDMVTIE